MAQLLVPQWARLKEICDVELRYPPPPRRIPSREEAFKRARSLSAIDSWTRMPQTVESSDLSKLMEVGAPAIPSNRRWRASSASLRLRSASSRKRSSSLRLAFSALITRDRFLFSASISFAISASSSAKAAAS